MKYFLSKVITLRRLRAIDSNRSAYSATGTAVGYPSSIQEPNPAKQQMYGGQIGNLYEVYLEEDCPVADGDQIRYSGATYSVQNTKVMDFGSQHYKRATVIKQAS